MRGAPLLLALALAGAFVAATLVAVAPPAQARTLCSNVIDAWCPALVCIPDFHGGMICSRELGPVCVRDDCWGLP